MKTTFLQLSMATLMLSPIALAVGCSDRTSSSSTSSSSGSSQKTTETDSNGWFGGHTHELNTTYKNPDGSSSVETETTTTKDGTTTIERTKTTTNSDGTTKVDKESRKVVAGSESTSESHTSN